MLFDVCVCVCIGQCWSNDKFFFYSNQRVKSNVFFPFIFPQNPQESPHLIITGSGTVSLQEM